MHQQQFNSPFIEVFCEHFLENKKKSFRFQIHIRIEFTFLFSFQDGYC